MKQFMLSVCFQSFIIEHFIEQTCLTKHPNISRLRRLTTYLSRIFEPPFIVPSRRQKLMRKPLKIKLFGCFHTSYIFRHQGKRERGGRTFFISILSQGGNFKHLLQCERIIEDEIQIVKRLCVFACRVDEGSYLFCGMKISSEQTVLIKKLYFLVSRRLQNTSRILSV